MAKPSFADNLTALQTAGKLKKVRPKKGKKPDFRPKGDKVDKVAKTMHEFKHGTLRSGSKTGPKVKSRKQAIAIGLSEQRRLFSGRY